MKRVGLWAICAASLCVAALLGVWLLNYHRFNLWASKVDPQALDVYRSAATVIVAVIAASIAGLIQFGQLRAADRAREVASFQANTAERKLKLDLFEKRYKILTDIKAAIQACLESNGKTPETLQNFAIVIEPVRYLFDKEIYAYLRTDFVSQLEMYILARRTYNEFDIYDPRRAASDDQMTKHWQWIVEQDHELNMYFGPYLSFEGAIK